MDVTEVLRGRLQESPGLQRMTAISVLVHAATLAIVIVGSGRWPGQASPAPQPVMTLTLGAGAPGPQSGGRTATGGRTVQAETPREAVAKPKPATPPAAAPAMTLPQSSRARATTPAPPDVKHVPDAAPASTPSAGPEAVTGSTAVETQVRGQGFGLSTSGGVGVGVRLDVSFCCQDYLDVMSQRITQNWDSRAEVPRDVTVVFVIARDGTLSRAVVETSSGFGPLDIRAQRAIATTRQLPPLPDRLPNPTLTVHLTFRYTR